MKKIFIALMVLIASNAYAQDAGGDFYVIPVPVEVEVIKEVCSGIGVGARAFELSVTNNVTRFRVGSVFPTTSGKLVQITGISPCGLYDCTVLGYSFYRKGDSFRVTPSSMPPPPSSGTGVKGTFYNLYEGGTTFAKYL